MKDERLWRISVMQTSLECLSVKWENNLEEIRERQNRCGLSQLLTGKCGKICVEPEFLNFSLI